MYMLGACSGLRQDILACAALPSLAVWRLNYLRYRHARLLGQHNAAKGANVCSGRSHTETSQGGISPLIQESLILRSSLICLVRLTLHVLQD